MTERDFAIKIAWGFLGQPYLWGGDDPIRGFDCSGLIVEILKSVGKLPRKSDYTAAGLWDKFKSGVVDCPDEGNLVFWENAAGKIVHVEMCLNETLSIGASGGGSKTNTLQDAVHQNAYIKIRPIKSRSRIKGYIDVFEPF